MKKSHQTVDEEQGLQEHTSIDTNSTQSERIGYASFQRQSNSNSKRASVRNIRDAFENAIKNSDTTRFNRSESVKSSVKESGVKYNISNNGVSKHAPVLNVSDIPSDKYLGESEVCSVQTKEGFPKKEVTSVGKVIPDADVLDGCSVDSQKAQNRLAKSQSLIEQLQQNLATKLNPATVEAFRLDYSPALERRSLHTFTPANSHLKDNENRSNETNYSKLNPKSEVLPKLRSRKIQFLNSIFGSSLTKPKLIQNKNSDLYVNETKSTPKESNGVLPKQEKVCGPILKRLESEGSRKPLLSKTECTPKKETHTPSIEPNTEQVVISTPAKPARIPWTTRLIQKLTEEEDRAKNKPHQPLIQRPRRTVRFPQKKPTKPERKDWPKYFYPTKPKPEENSDVKADLTTAAGSKDRIKRESVSGVVLNNKDKDAFASIIPQLVEENKSQSIQELVSQIDGEDPQLKQKIIEEIRADLARQECEGITSSDEDSIIAVPVSFLSAADKSSITASTGKKDDAGRGSKPTGIRRLLPQNLFNSGRQSTHDRRDDESVLEPLLTRRGDKVYPTTPRPVVETAFLSDSQTKLPIRSVGVRSQSSSPAGRQKQLSPKGHRHIDQASVLENEQNFSRLQPRSKSLSPARERRSSSNGKRTIPDTSLILEERLQHIRREMSSPPRPASATPIDRQNRMYQKQSSLPSSPARTRVSPKASQGKNYQNTSKNVNSPSDAYYHSPPNRRRSHNSQIESNPRKVSGGSSVSSSSTIVAESPYNNLSWNPLLQLNIEQQAISCSPDIRKFQQMRYHRVGGDNSPHGEIRNGELTPRNDSPDNFYQSNSGSIRKGQGLLQVQNISPNSYRNSSIPSGRLSAPPVPSYYVEDYPRRRVVSPEPARSRYDYDDINYPRRSLSQPPRIRQTSQKQTPATFQPVIPTEKQAILPVSAQVKITATPSPKPENNKETQTARSFVQQEHYRQVATVPDGHSPQDKRSQTSEQIQKQYKKLSRQEIERLYWETQKLRAGLSSLSQQISPEVLRSPHYMSSQPQLSPAQRNALQSGRNSPVYQNYPSPRLPYRSQSDMNIGGGYGSLIVKPQPIYNNSQQQHPEYYQSRAAVENPRVTRARSVSPGPNSDRHLSSRSLSLPRSVPASVMNEDVNYFHRGAPQRNTIGPIRSTQHSPQIRHQSTPTIYEEPPNVGENEMQLRHKNDQNVLSAGHKNKSNNNKSFPAEESSKKPGNNRKNKKSIEPILPHHLYYPPIFKRGSLISNSTSSVDGVSDASQMSMTPKRVSFTSNLMEGNPDPAYWPTRNGPAPEPPTRQRKNIRPDSTDSEVFLPNSPFSSYEEYSTYANLPAMMHSKLEAPNRPLPPVPRSNSNGTSYGIVAGKNRISKSPASIKDTFSPPAYRWQQQSDTESGSEAGEVQRILQQGSYNRGTYFRFPEEEWGSDGKSRGPPGTDQSVSNVGRDDEVRRSGGGGGRSGRRDEPRRHTLSGDHHHHQQGGALARSMDLEMSSKSQRRKSPLPRGYPPPSTAMLFDDDPGIMSEVETSSTGFRRGGKQRSSLPVVRTPSKTLERPLGLVFLQYRSETKRALLPNEITSIDTVKALFVRSFPKQLTMEYLDSPHVKIYIHDSSKDMFYELEDLRSHLRDIRDRSVLRLFESTDMNGGVLPGAGVGVVAPPIWDQDQSYFSEPEFDSEYQHQHIHKSKTSSKSGSSGVPPQAPYYMTHSYPPGGSQGGPGSSATLPRGGPLLRAYSPAVAPPVPADRIKTLPQSADRLHAESGYMSSPERGGPRAYPAAAYPTGGQGYEDPYYSQYASRSGSITPVIDEEARIRVEHMERQLANLTGLVQKALTQTPTPREYLQVPPPASSRDANYRNGL